MDIAAGNREGAFAAGKSRRGFLFLHGSPFNGTPSAVSLSCKQDREDNDMRGYYTHGGYYGLVSGKYMLFASESDYYDYMSGENA